MKQALSMIVPPLMVGLHMATGWDGILVFLGVMFVFGGIILVSGMYFIEEKVAVIKQTPAELVVSIFNCVMYLAYFAHINSFVLIGLFTTLLLLALTFKYTCTKK